MTPTQQVNPTQTATPLSGSELLRQLQRVPILASLDEVGLRCLDGVDQLQFAAGELIERQDDAARFFWILLSGEVSIVRRSEDKIEQMVTLPEGSAFGELPLLAGIQNPANIYASRLSTMLRLTEDQFWKLMTTCSGVRKAILGNMAFRLQKMQSTIVQQEKMASLGTLAAGLMHELNNPGAAARRASTQLRENLIRLHELGARFTRTTLSESQKDCLLELQAHVLQAKPLQLNTLEQSDAEEALVDWMEAAEIENAWKIAPTLASVGINADELGCARSSFDGTVFSDALNWLDALISSMQLVGTIEESIGRVSTLVVAVKSYAYEGKGQRQAINVNETLYATLLILGHKMREKQIVLKKSLDHTLPPLESTCSGLNQIWTNLLDNAIDAVGEHGHIQIRTWAEEHPGGSPDLCITIEDDGPGIPLESQPHIFDPFYTTKPVGVGTGLGLGIVYRLVEQFGGTIRFTSSPGSTMFLVRLPAKQSAPATPSNVAPIKDDLSGVS